MTYTFLWIAPIFAMLDWIAVEKRWKLLEYVVKPGTMVVLLAWLWQNGAFSGWMVWFVFGVVFSLAGDVFLMLPSDQFVAGLVAFLLAHVAYIVGFSSALPSLGLLSLLAPVFLGLYCWQFYMKLAAGLEARGKESLKAPVLVYAIVICLMVFSALLTLTREEWKMLPAWLCSAGAVLFLLSDSMLAWDRFVKPLTHARLRVMVTYHLGQFGIVLGAALHFLR